MSGNESVDYFMQTWSLLYIINAGFIAIITLIHLRFTRKDFAANRMLSVFLFTLAYTAFLLFLFSSKWILDYPHFSRTGNFMFYLTYPAAYLYVRKILRQEGWKIYDILHLLPALLFVIDFIPYFNHSAAEKRLQLEHDFAKDDIYLIQDSWLFPHLFHFKFRSILALFYTFTSANCWYQTFIDKADSAFRKENRSLMHWTFFLTLLLFIGILPSITVYLFNIPLKLEFIINLSWYFITICFALFLFFHPDIIYGLKGLWVDEIPIQQSPDSLNSELAVGNTGLVHTESNLNPARKIYLREETVKKLAQAMDNYLEHDRSFLRTGFSIVDLSAAVGYPMHQVSAYLNNHLDMNFNEFVNTQRINYLLRQLQENQEWRMFTLEALGQKVGFNNRYTFLNAFKKVTGETPSVFLKSWKTQ